MDAAIAFNRGEQYLETNNQPKKVGGDPEARKRCHRRGDNTMTSLTATTTTMKQQSTSTYQVVEEEQRCHSAAEEDGGWQERTVVEEKQLCGRVRALLDPAREEGQMTIPWRQTRD